MSLGRREHTEAGGTTETTMRQEQWIRCRGRRWGTANLLGSAGSRGEQVRWGRDGTTCIENWEMCEMQTAGSAQSIQDVRADASRMSEAGGDGYAPSTRSRGDLGCQQCSERDGAGTLWIYVVWVESNGGCSHRVTRCNTYKDFVVAGSTDSRQGCTEQWRLESTFRWGGGERPEPSTFTGAPGGEEHVYMGTEATYARRGDWECVH